MLKNSTWLTTRIEPASLPSLKSKITGCETRLILLAPTLASPPPPLEVLVVNVVEGEVV